MDERLEIGAVTYPLVRHAQGGPAPDNNALLVEAATADGQPVRFALSLADVQHFVAFLLISVGKIGVMRGDQISDGPIGQCGEAEIVFSIPLSAFGELGRTLLTLSAKPNGPYTA
jgi:hypothetical protein